MGTTAHATGLPPVGLPLLSDSPPASSPSAPQAPQTPASQPEMPDWALPQTPQAPQTPQTPPPAGSSDEIRVSLDDSFLGFDQPPVIVNDRTMVPFRGIFEALGATVDFNEATRQAVGTLDGTTVLITIDQDSAIVNGQFVELDAPAFIMEETGRTLVPLRFIAESFDAEVEWNGTQRIVEITRAAQMGNYMVGAVPNNTTYGSVTVSPSGIGISAGASITLQATPTPGHRFRSWVVISGGIVLTDNPTQTFIMPSGNVSVQAVFEPDALITLQPNVAQRGSVTSNPSLAGASEGTNVSITATANTGYAFVRWETSTHITNVTGATTPTVSFAIPAGQATITAVFEAVGAPQTLTITRNDTNQGDVSISPALQQGSFAQQQTSQQAGQMPTGTSVTLNAAPRSGFTFYRWEVVSGGVTVQNPTNSTLTFTMPANSVTIRAEFRPSSAVNFSVSPSNSGDVALASGSPANPASGQTVNIVATPRSGYEFVGWVVLSPSNLTIQNQNSTNASFTMPSSTTSVSIRGDFRQAQALTVNASSANTAMGSVTPATFPATQGQNVTIHALPNSGFIFSHWVITSGSIPTLNVTSASTTFAMPNQSVTLVAHFTSFQ